MQIYLRIIRSNISEKFVIVNYKYEIKHRNYLRTRIELRFRFTDSKKQYQHRNQLMIHFQNGEQFLGPSVYI